MEDEEETISVEQKSFDDALDKLLESKKKSKVASLEQIFNILKDKFQLVDYDTK
jgi:predicted CopG family antitoxin